MELVASAPATAVAVVAHSGMAQVVPDTWLSQSLHQLTDAKAATVSSLVLIGLLRGSGGGYREGEVSLCRTT